MKERLKKLFEIKVRDFKKPISLMVASLADIKKLAYVDKTQTRFIKALLPGPFTVILKKKKIISPLLTAGRKGVGIRIPSSRICRALVRNLPITATSANISNKKFTLNVKKLAKIFQDKVELILVGKGLSGKPSTVIDLTQMPPKILR